MSQTKVAQSNKGSVAVLTGKNNGRLLWQVIYPATGEAYRYGDLFYGDAQEAIFWTEMVSAKEVKP